MTCAAQDHLSPLAQSGAFLRARKIGPVALLAAAAFSWGLSTAMSKVALEQLTPVDLLGVEVGVAAVVLAALAVGKGARPGKPQPTLLLLGVLEPGLAYLLFDIGLNRTAATHAALLISTETLFVVILAAVLLRERLDRRMGVALGAAAIGSALLTWQSGGARASLMGDILVLAASLTGACYSVLARQVAPGRDVLHVTAVQMVGALLVAAPITLAYIITGHTNLGRADADHLAIAVSVGLLGSVFPFLLFNAAISKITATLAGLLLTLIPVFGSATSIFLLGETIGIPQVVGGALVILAAAAVTVATPTSP